MQHQFGFAEAHLSTPLPSPVQSVPIITPVESEELEADRELEVVLELEEATELEEVSTDEEEVSLELELVVSLELDALALAPSKVVGMVSRRIKLMAITDEMKRIVLNLFVLVF